MEVIAGGVGVPEPAATAAAAAGERAAKRRRVAGAGGGDAGRRSGGAAWEAAARAGGRGRRRRAAPLPGMPRRVQGPRHRAQARRGPAAPRHARCVPTNMHVLILIILLLRGVLIVITA